MVCFPNYSRRKFIRINQNRKKFSFIGFTIQDRLVNTFLHLIKLDEYTKPD